MTATIEEKDVAPEETPELDAPVVRVTGDSMERAGISDGDELIVNRALEPKDGSVVVAVLDGELTVKRLRITPTGVVLQAENPSAPLIDESLLADLPADLAQGVVALGRGVEVDADLLRARRGGRDARPAELGDEVHVAPGVFQPLLPPLVVSVIVWLCKSHRPDVCGDISPYE